MILDHSQGIYILIADTTYFSSLYVWYIMQRYKTPKANSKVQNADDFNFQNSEGNHYVQFAFCKNTMTMFVYCLFETGLKKIKIH